MHRENHNLKRSLVLQSFAPLFLLLTVKHIAPIKYFHLFQLFIKTWCSSGTQALDMALNHKALGGIIVSFVGIIWVVLAILIALGYRGTQKAGFASHAEKIIIEEMETDNSATFLVSYVLPLLTDDVDSLRGLIVFFIMLFMVITLLSASNTFYQNPVLVAMNYKTFSFKFDNPWKDIKYPKRTYIGITRKDMIDDKDIIIRKYIADNVFMVYRQDNENTQDKSGSK